MEKDKYIPNSKIFTWFDPFDERNTNPQWIDAYGEYGQYVGNPYRSDTAYRPKTIKGHTKGSSLT